MKNLLSIWSGRLLPFLVFAFLASCFLFPADALASDLEISVGRDRIGGGDEGDPLDTNDVGGGGGGGSDMHVDGSNSSAIDSPLEIGSQVIKLILVPEFLNGKIVFRMLVISATGSYLQIMQVEGYHAP